MCYGLLCITSLSALQTPQYQYLTASEMPLVFIGLWALAKKYLEQWWIWIVVDAELSALYIYKGIPFTAMLYALYTVIAVAGYFKWRRYIKQQK